MMDKQTRTLVIDADELYFSAAHWLPEHPKCGRLHGHTYFVRNLRVMVNGFVDLGDIKAAIKEFDHKPLVCSQHQTEWLTMVDWLKKHRSPLFSVFKDARFILKTDIPGTTVERIAEELQGTIERIPGVIRARFTLCEGPTAGVAI